jgi:aspartyl-tRNA(Asn)/glutamyl-tRNA(Gln) amidotransferase subunit A
MPANSSPIPKTASDPGRVAEMAREIRDGNLSPVALVERCISRINEIEPKVSAWRELSCDQALQTAREREEEAGKGLIRGPLHGIPIGIKDIIDVAGLPTRCNTRSRRNAPPATADAEIVLQLKGQGGIVLGKAHTTEYAYFDPSPARNPWNTDHTPGGSSSGSAAAVGAGMVPIALGTQTMASVNRPAAYCGVAAFKPSGRLLPTFGVTPLAASYDTVGFFGARVEDAAFVFDAVSPPFLKTPTRSIGRPRSIVLLKDPLIGDMHADMKTAYRRMADTLANAGYVIKEHTAGISFERLVELQKSTLLYEASRIYKAFLESTGGGVGARFLEALEEGQAIGDTQYLDARGELADLQRTLLRSYALNDVFLWPAATSSAPKGLQWTGDPRYIAPWTAIGGPVVTIPAGLGENDLPIGCILCGAPGTDVEMSQWSREIASICEISPYEPAFYCAS